MSPIVRSLSAASHDAAPPPVLRPLSAIAAVLTVLWLAGCTTTTTTSSATSAGIVEPSRPAPPAQPPATPPATPPGTAASAPGAAVPPAAAAKPARPLLSFEELSNCAQMLSGLRSTSQRLQAQNGQLAQTGRLLDADGDRIEADRARVDVSNAAQVQAYNARLARHKADVERYNAAIEPYNTAAMAHRVSEDYFNEACAQRGYRPADRARLPADLQAAIDGGLGPAPANVTPSPLNAPLVAPPATR